MDEEKIDFRRVYLSLKKSGNIILATLYEKDNRGKVTNKKLREEKIVLKLSSEKEIIEYRFNMTKQIMIIKQKGKIYSGVIPQWLSIGLSNTLNLKHLCSNCKHCMASSDFDGGCEKIRDYDMSFCNKNKGKFKRLLRENSIKRLEKYQFITDGIETINTDKDVLIVVSCRKFEIEARRKI